ARGELTGGAQAVEELAYVDEPEAEPTAGLTGDAGVLLVVLERVALRRVDDPLELPLAPDHQEVVDHAHRVAVLAVEPVVDPLVGPLVVLALLGGLVDGVLRLAVVLGRHD